jgi:hypothetical protein
MTSIEWLASKLSVTFNTMYAAEIEQAKEMEKQQMQISDKQIENAAPLGNPSLEEGFIRGAKWYREQISSKADKNQK